MDWIQHDSTGAHNSPLYSEIICDFFVWYITVYNYMYRNVPPHLFKRNMMQGSITGPLKRRTEPGSVQNTATQDAAEASNEPKASSPSSPRREATAPGVPPAPPGSSELNRGCLDLYRLHYLDYLDWATCHLFPSLYGENAYYIYIYLCVCVCVCVCAYRGPLQ